MFASGYTAEVFTSIGVSYLDVLLPKLKARRASSTRRVSIFSL